jgi:hypothetical protein
MVVSSEIGVNNLLPRAAELLAGITLHAGKRQSSKSNSHAVEEVGRERSEICGAIPPSAELASVGEKTMNLKNASRS